jgi:hypothetical protein
VVEVQVTRRTGTTGSDFPEPKSCNIGINAFATNSSHIGKKYATSTGFDWVGTEIKGNLLGGSGAFPSLQPGASTNFLIILQPTAFWLPGHIEFVKMGWKPEPFDDWNLLYEGANAEIKANGHCKFEFPEGVGYSDIAITGDSKQVGPLGEAYHHFCYPNCP